MTELSKGAKNTNKNSTLTAYYNSFFMALFEYIFAIILISTLIAKGDIIQFGNAILIISFGFIGQRFISGPIFFQSNSFETEIKRINQKAILFGRVISLDRSSKDIQEVKKRIIIRSLFFLVTFYLILSKFGSSSLGFPRFNLPAFIIAATVAFVFKPTMIWIPALLSLLMVLRTDLPKDVPVVNGVLFLIVLLVLTGIFSIYIRSIHTSYATSQKAANLGNPLTREKFRSNMVLAATIGCIIFSYCWLTDRQKSKKSEMPPKNPFISNSTSSFKSNDEFPFGFSEKSQSQNQISEVFNRKKEDRNADEGGGLANINPFNRYGSGSGSGSGSGIGEEGEAGLGGRMRSKSGIGDEREAESGGGENEVGGNGDSGGESGGRGSNTSQSGGEIGDGDTSQRSNSTNQSRDLSDRAGQSKAKFQTSKISEPTKRKNTEKWISKLAKLTVVILAISIVVLIFNYSFKKIDSVQKKVNHRKKASDTERKKKEAIQLLKEKTNHHMIHTALTEREIRDQIIYLYGLLVKTNTLIGVVRPSSMTPDEYLRHVSSQYGNYENALQFVTNVYCKVFYGNQIPRFDIFSRYVKAIDASIIKRL